MRALILLLALAVFGSALLAVRSAHQSRALFQRLQTLEGEAVEMKVEWGRLQLELGTLATHGRVERLARERLGMAMPRPEQIVVVRP
ncbi:MAG TPA: cell division protein FtsL [Thiotrichales bacterium]|nr:cell division protein FtsL [Thiotrichales bacterium]